MLNVALCDAKTTESVAPNDLWQTYTEKRWIPGVGRGSCRGYFTGTSWSSMVLLQDDHACYLWRRKHTAAPLIIRVKQLAYTGVLAVLIYRCPRSRLPRNSRLNVPLVERHRCRCLCVEQRYWLAQGMPVSCNQATAVFQPHIKWVQLRTASCRTGHRQHTSPASSCSKYPSFAHSLGRSAGRLMVLAAQAHQFLHIFHGHFSWLQWIRVASLVRGGITAPS